MLINCTLSGNSAGSGGGGGTSIGEAKNCIICGNTASNIWEQEVTGTLLFSSASPDAVHGIDGNITNAPLFADAAAGNYRLGFGSPCIDAGTNMAWMTVATDLDGLPRTVSGTVDMGAYEYDGTFYDTDGDTMPDDWEDLHGLDPVVEDASANPDTDPFDNKDEYTADTDPTDSDDWFRIAAIGAGPPATIHFDSSSNRLYTLLWSADLVSNAWTNVPGAPSRMGIGGSDSMIISNALPTGFYKLEVAVP